MPIQIERCILCVTETAQHWDRLTKNQPAEITMFQILEVQESPAFNGRLSFLTLRGLKDITESPGELLATIDRSVRAFAFAAGIRVGNEGRLEDRFQHARQRMMHDAIPVRGSTDEPLLWFKNIERAVIAGTIGFAEQLLSQLPQFPFQCEFEANRSWAKAFAPLCLLG